MTLDEIKTYVFPLNRPLHTATELTIKCILLNLQRPTQNSNTLAQTPTLIHSTHTHNPTKKTINIP